MPSALNAASILPGRNATWDQFGMVQTIEEQYQVLRGFTDVQPSPTAIAGLPQTGAAHPTLADLVVVGHEPREDATGVRWVITVRYERVGTVVGGSFKRLRREWDTQDASRDLLYDAGTGLPMLNAAGDPFDRVPGVFHADRVLRVVRQENTAPATGLAMSGTINSAAVTAPGGISLDTHKGLLKIKCRETDPTGTSSPTYKYEYIYEIYERTMMAKINGALTDIGWDESFVERGYYYLDAVGGNRVRALEDIDLGPPEGVISRPTTEPVLLAADGTELAAGADPIIKRVQAIKEADWSTLLLSL